MEITGNGAKAVKKSDSLTGFQKKIYKYCKIYETVTIFIIQQLTIFLLIVVLWKNV